MDFVTVITYLKDLFATIMILLTMLSPAFGGNGVAYEAEKPDELITSFVVVSDIHVETNQPKSYQNLNDVLYGIKAGKDIDTVIYTGDNVMNGQLLENFFFYTWCPYDETRSVIRLVTNWNTKDEEVDAILAAL